MDPPVHLRDEQLEDIVLRSKVGPTVCFCVRSLLPPHVYRVHLQAAVVARAFAAKDPYACHSRSFCDVRQHCCFRFMSKYIDAMTAFKAQASSLALQLKPLFQRTVNWCFLLRSRACRTSMLKTPSRFQRRPFSSYLSLDVSAGVAPGLQFGTESS
jgi:hypothetical protein